MPPASYFFTAASLALYVGLVISCVAMDDVRLYTVSHCIDGRLGMQIGFTAVVVLHGFACLPHPPFYYLVPVLVCIYISLSLYTTLHYLAIGLAAAGVLVAFWRTPFFVPLVGIAAGGAAAVLFASKLVAPMEHAFFITTIASRFVN
jgi:hypothetical protein